MDFYVNPRIANVRVVQYAVIATAIGVTLIGLNDGGPEFALLFGGIGAICVVAFEVFYIRKYVTRIRKDATAGWILKTLSTIGEREIRFDPHDAILGGEITEHVREVGVNYHYPLHISGTRYVLDTTPPVQVDIAALRRALGR